MLLMFSALSGWHKRYIFCSYVLMFFCPYVLRVSGKSYRAHILLSIRFMVVNTIRFSTKVKCCKGNTEALHPTKKVYNLYTNICPLPVIPLIKECVRFYCHLTLFVRNRLIYRGFKSVRWFQSILHTPAHILHTTPRRLAVVFVVCGGFYATGT